MALRIPGKTLEDNFKLADFQGDFSELQNLFIKVASKPKRIEFVGYDGMEVTFNDNRVEHFKIYKTGNQISRIVNLSDNKELIIGRR